MTNEQLPVCKICGAEPLSTGAGANDRAICSGECEMNRRALLRETWIKLMSAPAVGSLADLERDAWRPVCDLPTVEGAYLIVFPDGCVGIDWHPGPNLSPWSHVGHTHWRELPKGPK